MANPHILLAGLGNITYPTTRHSLGHYMIDVLATRLGVHLSSQRTGFTAKTTVDIGQDRVDLTLFKPRALMNISGRPVAQMLHANPINLIVMHDSVDHKPCVVSPKFGGSANGHNGIRSVIVALNNNPDFHRIRLGVGRGPDNNLAEYVLGPLSREEREYWSASGTGSDVVWRELTRIIQKNLRA